MFLFRFLQNFSKMSKRRYLKKPPLRLLQIVTTPLHTKGLRKYRNIYFCSILNPQFDNSRIPNLNSQGIRLILQRKNVMDSITQGCSRYVGYWPKREPYFAAKMLLFIFFYSRNKRRLDGVLLCLIQKYGVRVRLKIFSRMMR